MEVERGGASGLLIGSEKKGVSIWLTESNTTQTGVLISHCSHIRNLERNHIWLLLWECGRAMWLRATELESQNHSLPSWEAVSIPPCSLLKHVFAAIVSQYNLFLLELKSTALDHIQEEALFSVEALGHMPQLLARTKAQQSSSTWSSDYRAEKSEKCTRMPALQLVLQAIPCINIASWARPDVQEC